MNYSETMVRIDSILFDNTDTKVLINGETFKEHLSYQSQLLISFTELNQLLNRLQQLNPEVCVSELFEEERLDEAFTQHYLNARVLNQSMIELNHCLSDTDKKQIRA